MSKSPYAVAPGESKNAEETAKHATINQGVSNDDRSPLEQAKKKPQNEKPAQGK